MIGNKGEEVLPFYKFSGSGNDFIIIDNRKRILEENNLPNYIAKVCQRRMSIGADGLILVENHPHPEKVDFKWRFFNADGSIAEMCGNGARCVARFAFLQGIAESSMSFENEAGIVTAEIKGDRVKLNMPNPAKMKVDFGITLSTGSLTISSVNTGVPHVVVFMEPDDEFDVVGTGREIRFHPFFEPAGTNVNFVHVKKDDTIAVRTYERGVEDETLACGTGAIASALVAARKYQIQSPVYVETKGGGYLGIYFDSEDGRYGNIYLEGDARLIYRGKMGHEAWAY